MDGLWIGMLLFSSDSDNDNIYRSHNGESESETESFECGKEQLAMQGEITHSKLNNGDGNNEGESDDDGGGDGENGVQTIDCAKSLLFSVSFKIKYYY